MVTTELLELCRAKLQPNHHHQQTNIQFFYRPKALPVAQPTVSEDWMEIYSHFLPRQNPERFVTFCYRLSEAVVQIGCYTSVPTSAKEVLFSSALICLSAEMKGSVKEPNMFHNYETEKMTRKASDVAENLQL